MNLAYCSSTFLNRPSPNLEFKFKHLKGFTLLELLIVITILGVTLLFIIPAFTAPSNKQIINKETKKLAQLIHLAANDATLNSRRIGIQLNEKSYRFLIKKDNSWLILKDKILKLSRMPAELRINLINKPILSSNSENEFSSISENNERSPNIIISTSGELSPFSLQIIGKDNVAYYELIGQFSGHIRIKEIEQN